MNEWKVSVGRVTLFPASPTSFARVSGIDLYRKLWDLEPDSFQKQENPILPTVAQGRHGGISISCSVHPSRIDFNFGSAPPAVPSTSSLQLQLIENGRQLRRIFMELFDALARASLSADVNRVAINLQALAVKPNFAEINKAIMEVVPSHFGLRLTDEEDVIFQVNRPFISERIPTVRMNAASTWSGLRIQVVNFSIPASGIVNAAMAAASGNPRTKDFLAASVVFDVNNLPTANQISLADQTSLLREAFSHVEQKQAELGLFIEGFKNV